MSDRERKFGEDSVRFRLPRGLGARLDQLAERSYRSIADQCRYLLMLGLEVEERRQAAADAATEILPPEPTARARR